MYLPLYDYLMGRMDSLGWYAPLAAGASSRTAAVLCTSPLELLRTRAQVGKQKMVGGVTSKSGDYPCCMVQHALELLTFIYLQSSVAAPQICVWI